MALTVNKIKALKPGIKPDGTIPSNKSMSYRVFDEKGLYIEVFVNGSKYWRMKYRIADRERRASLGVFPETSLAEAREMRDELRKQLKRGLDPSEIKTAQKASRAGADSFESITREWHAKQSKKWSVTYSEDTLDRFCKHVFPWIGEKHINEIKAPQVLALCRRLESQGKIDTAHRLVQIIGQAFRYGIATGRCEHNPAGDLRGALTPNIAKHHPSITEPKAIGELLRAINGYTGSFPVACALKLAPLVFVRPGELRRAEWSEIDFETKEWRIPAEKMKMRAIHIVPLSEQSLEILKELRPLTGHGKYLFPSNRSQAVPMSENTINASLRRLGYTKEEMTGHGFRSLASTLLHEQGWPSDWIERQLAHSERNSIKAAYNYAQHLPDRKRMMQSWADYLDGLKTGGTIIPFPLTN